MKAFITGINGFAGSYLAESLIKKGRQVSGSVQPGTPLDNLAGIPKLSLITLDINDYRSLEIALLAEKPDEIYHLAAISNVNDSLSDPRRCFEVNVLGSLNLLEILRLKLPGAALLLASSSEIYGESLTNHLLIDEEAPILPRSHYAVSKASVDMLGKVYAKNYGLKIIIARPASYIGPRQTKPLFLPSVASQIVELEKTGGGEIRVGNIEMDRDFTDVRDVVEAYVLLAEKGRSGEAYNICRGETRRLKELVDRLIGLARVPIKVTIDPGRCRPSDLTGMKIDNRKLQKETGWRPGISIEKTLVDILEYWRKLV